MNRIPSIDSRFEFAHEKPSELEISFPGGSVRITAGETHGDPVEMIVSTDDGIRINPPSFKVYRDVFYGAILRLSPVLEVVEGQMANPKLPQPENDWEGKTFDTMDELLDDLGLTEQREALASAGQRALKMMQRRGLIEHLPEMIANDQEYEPQVGDRVRATAYLILAGYDDKLVHIAPGDLGTITATYLGSPGINVDWDKGAQVDLDDFQIEVIDEEDEDDAE